MDYFALDGVPGRYFVCTVFHTTLGVTSCAGRWKEAQNGRRFDTCKGCVLGAEHAGHAQAVHAPESYCCRCGEAVLRKMVKGVCVSCKNREYEVVKGRNGKGAPISPVDVFYGAEAANMVVALHHVKVYAISGGRSKKVDFSRVADPLEAFLRAMREFDIAPTFSRAYVRSSFRQQRLFF